MTSLHAQIRKTKHFVPNRTLKGMENDTPANQTKCFSLHCSQPNKDVKAIDVMHSHICSWPLAIHPVLAMSGISKVVRCQSLQFIDLARSWSEKTLLTDGFLLESSPWHTQSGFSSISFTSQAAVVSVSSKCCTYWRGQQKRSCWSISINFFSDLAFHWDTSCRKLQSYF